MVGAKTGRRLERGLLQHTSEKACGVPGATRREDGKKKEPTGYGR